MIASRQPKEINEIVERYNKDHNATEAGYLDLIIKSGCLLTYKDIMEMPVTTLAAFVSRFNEYTEERNAEAKKAAASARSRR